MLFFSVQECMNTDQAAPLKFRLFCKKNCRTFHCMDMFWAELPGLNLVKTPSVLNDLFCGFLKSFHAKAGVLLYILKFHWF